MEAIEGDFIFKGFDDTYGREKDNSNTNSINNVL